jgi:hypothetical protein
MEMKLTAILSGHLICTNLAQLLWVPVTNTVESTGAMFSVTLGTDDSGGHWYRLQSD